MAYMTSDKPRTRSHRETILLTEEEARQWRQYVEGQARPGERPNASLAFRDLLRDRGILSPGKIPKKSSQGG